MKLFKTSVTFLFLTTTSFAESTSVTCTDAAAGPDHGYIVEVDADFKNAVVLQQTIAGPVEMSFGQLACSPSDQNNGSLKTISVCTSKNVADGGYAFELSSGGVVGGMLAELFEVTLKGRNKIANLFCNQ